MTTSLRTMLSVATLRRPDFWERSWKHRLARIAIYLVFVYAVVLVAVLLLEDQFLYGPRRTELDKPPSDVQVESVDLTSQRGDRINAWWSKAEDWRPEQGAVLFCHGNAGNLSHRGRVLSRWIKDMGLAVLIFDYPGFGRSSGQPCEEGCYAAGDAAYDWLCQKAKVPPERIVLYGGSLGGGIATDLASRKPHWALVLVATFTSIPDMAQSRFPWLPARWLARHRYDNLDKIAHCRGPVFVAHSPQDGLIPFTQGERLFAAAAEPKRFFAMPNYRHNDLPTAEFYPTLHRFLADCARTAN